MKLNSLIKGMVLSIPLLLTSCNDEEQTAINNKCRVVCSVDKFESESLSRTNTDPNNNFLITWASGDVIGIFPREGYQEPFEIPADQVGNKSASFDGGYWDVKDGLQYNAYYPFDKRNFDSADMKTKIPVTYVGQKQNGTSCDIGAFDYTYSDWGTAVDGKIGFDFHHIGAISVFSLKYPATTTYTKMTLSVDDALIPLEGSYDLTAEEVSFVANESSMAESITLTLENCSGVAGETGVFYMMLPPMMDLSNNVVTLSLTSAAGTICTYSIDKTLNTKSGKLYRRTGIPIDSKVEGTVDGWVEDEEDEIPYITFTAEATQSLSMSKAVETLEYSVNGGEWKTLGTTTVAFGGNDGNLRLRGKSSYGTSTSDYTYSQIEFWTNASVICQGDIRTLIDYDNYATVNTENARFCRLFYECSVLTKAPALPSMTLADYCYSRMFYGCTGLTEAPLLPATTLKDGCYFYMFEGCVNLTKAPLLTAEALAIECYKGMFENCRSLIEAPALPAKQLASACYSRMFYGCESLVKAPALPAEILTESCYSSMFNGCKRLEEAPSLPATILAKYCYSYMFWGCEALTEAPLLPSEELAIGCYNGMFMKCVGLTETPELSAKTLVGNCYSSMFWGCTNLNKVTMLAADINASGCLNDWLYNVSSTGTIIKAEDMSSLPSGASGIPSGWTVKNYGEEEDLTPYVTFMTGATSGVPNRLSMSKSVPSLEYSVGGSEWTELGTTSVLFGGEYGELRLRGKSLTGTEGAIISFVHAQDIVLCTGDIRTLVDYENYETVSTANAKFYSLFSGCSALGSAPALPATNLAESCYSGMFSGCTSLTTAPALLATTLSDNCYNQMFFGCTSLTTAPVLSARNLASACYNEMFRGCVGLVSAPALPATTLAEYCYNSMFYGCTKLTETPELPAAVLKFACYTTMFADCNNLKKVTMLATDVSATGCLMNWLSGVSSTGTFTKAPTMESLPSGTSGIPSGWTVVDYEE